MKKILFPTDFSDTSAEMVKYALAFADGEHSTLVLLHAFGKPTLLEEKATDLEEKEVLLKEKLTRFIAQNIRTPNGKVKVKYVVSKNRPTKAIIDAAQKEAIDLIVMGVSIESTLTGNYLTDSAKKIQAKVPCPLLLIPSEMKFKQIKNLVVTTDFLLENYDLLDFMKKLEKQFRANVHCLHVLEKIDQQVAVWKRMNDLEGRYRGQNFSFHCVKGRLQEEVVDFANRKHADIVVMIARQRGFFHRLSAILNLGKSVQKKDKY